MKTLIKTNKIILIVVGLLAILSFTIMQLSQEEEEIIGTWVNTESVKSKWVFNTNGKCYDYYDNALTDTYTYSIREETSGNGKLKHSFLKLININDSTDEYEYEINALGEGKMSLDYLGDTSAKLILFDKQ